MPFKTIRNDLTKMQVDAIVNTANVAPTYSSGTDTAVYKAAGEEELLQARSKIGRLREGEAAITLGFKLPAKYIIHAVSPRYMDGTYNEEKKLRSCYKKSLELALQYQCASIAFPLIATGSFGYPKEEGMRIALDEINAFLLKHEMLIYLVVFDTKATQLGASLYPDLEAYIDHNYVCEKREEEYGDQYLGSVWENVPDDDSPKKSRFVREAQVKRNSVEVEESCVYPVFPQKISAYEMPRSESIIRESPSKYYGEQEDDFSDFLEENESALRERMKHMSDTFQEYLMYLIKERNLTNAEVYKRAIVTKQLFSKIKRDPNYHPDKATAMRLCVGVKLNLDETKDLLARAGYALSPCDKRDIIFSFFIEHEVFDMIEIDIALEEHGLPCFIE